MPNSSLSFLKLPKDIQNFAQVAKFRHICSLLMMAAKYTWTKVKHRERERERERMTDSERRLDFLEESLGGGCRASSDIQRASY